MLRTPRKPRATLFALPLVALFFVVSVSPAEGVRPRPQRTQPGGPELRVVARAETGSNPKSAHMNPALDRVWVPNFGFRGHDNVYVYDANTLDRVGVVTFEGNGVEVAFTSDGRRAFVSNFRRGTIEQVNPTTYAVERSLYVGPNPKFMVLSPDDRYLFVAAYTGMFVAMVDLQSFEVVRRLRTGRRPRGMAMLPDGRLLVASFLSDFIQVFNTSTGEQLQRFRTCPMPRHLQIGRDPSRVYVTCTRGSIGVYDLATERRIIHAQAGTNPRSLDLSPDGRFAVVANYGGDSVSVYDIDNMRHHTTRVRGSDHIVGLAVGRRQVPGGDDVMRVFATSWRNNTLFVLEPQTPEPTASN